MASLVIIARRPLMNGNGSRTRVVVHCRSYRIMGARDGPPKVRSDETTRQYGSPSSWIVRFRAENLATPRQPVRHEVVTHLIGTWCYLSVRAGQVKAGGAGGIRTLDRALQPYNG